LLNRIWRWLIGPLLIGAGSYLVYRGTNGAQTYYQLGGTLLLWGLSLLIARLLERTSLRNETVMRISYSLLGIGLLVGQLESASGTLDLDVLINEQGWLLASFGHLPDVIWAQSCTVMFNADMLLGGLMSPLGGLAQ
jgi:hypothetical protein